MGEVIWGIDFRAKSRQDEMVVIDMESVEQQMIRDIMAIGYLPDEPFPWPWDKPAVDEPA